MPLDVKHCSVGVRVHSGFIRLTDGTPGKSGGIWATNPNPHKEWQVTLGFTANGKGVDGGKGLAFWYVRDRARAGNTFGGPDHWAGMGIFMDSYDDDGKVMGVFNCTC